MGVSTSWWGVVGAVQTFSLFVEYTKRVIESGWFFSTCSSIFERLGWIMKTSESGWKRIQNCAWARKPACRMFQKQGTEEQDGFGDRQSKVYDLSLHCLWGNVCFKQNNTNTKFGVHKPFSVDQWSSLHNLFSVQKIAILTGTNDCD